ncbi:MAG: S24 family peptidase [Arenicellales bacterium WSBS_2016_MAG_OTU3]
MSCKESESFALQVLGNSMAPEFVDGTIVIIEPGAAIENDCFVVAKNRDEFVLRQIKTMHKSWQLVTLDGEHEAIEIDSLACIRGRVIQRAGKRRRDHKCYL